MDVGHFQAGYPYDTWEEPDPCQNCESEWDTTAEVNIMGQCFTRGVVGHPARLCPKGGKGKGKEGGFVGKGVSFGGGGKGYKGKGSWGGKSGGKGYYGKGEGGGGKGFQGNCFNCGKKGHKGFECRSPAQTTNAVEQEQQQQQPTVHQHQQQQPTVHQHQQPTNNGTPTPYNGTPTPTRPIVGIFQLQSLSRQGLIGNPCSDNPCLCNP